MNLYENIKGNLKESNKEELVNSLINYLYDTYGDNFKLEDNVNGYTKNEEIYETLVTQYLEEKPDISFVDWVKNIIDDPHGLLIVKSLNEADNFKDMVMELHSYIDFADPKKIMQDVQKALKNKTLNEYLKSKALMSDDEIKAFKEKYTINEAVEVGYDDYYDFSAEDNEDTLYCDECGQPVKADFCYVSDETDPNPEIYCWPCHDRLVANGSLIDSEEE